MSWAIRPFDPADEASWLRCRVLGFLDTAYYDDVWPAKPPASGPDLVAATDSGVVAGILTMSGSTIDTVVVHPDYRRQGVGRALIDTVRPAGTLVAWTRDDPGTLSWYRAMGFTEDSHYLHVFADRSELLGAARPGLKLMAGFFHGALADEEWARANFRRVHVCRRFTLGAEPSSGSAGSATGEPAAT